MKKTISLRLIYGKNIAYLMESYKSHVIIKYADSNYANNCKNWKLFMIYCFFINRVVVIWSTKKQYIMSTSTIETKYIGLGYEVRKNI